MQKRVKIKQRRMKRRVCPFCVDKINILDYKDVSTLRRYITDRGKIVPKRNSGVCAKHQRMVTNAIKRSRLMGLIPHCVD